MLKRTKTPLDVRVNGMEEIEETLYALVEAIGKASALSRELAKRCADLTAEVIENSPVSTD